MYPAFDKIREMAAAGDYKEFPSAKSYMQTVTHR